jgi:hypothetical protein
MSAPLRRMRRKAGLKTRLYKKCQVGLKMVRRSATREVGSFTRRQKTRLYKRRLGFRVLAAALLMVHLRAEQPRAGAQEPPAQPPSGRAAAPIDLTGYWVSLITDDWRWRMMTPPKGDYMYLPLNAEGRRVTEAWDPDKDAAAGEECRAYGAAGVMRLPGRLHITWESDNILKIETDAGTQTRRFHFGAASAPAGERTWQGHSVARWDLPGGGRRAGGGVPPVAYSDGARPAAGRPRTGSLRVVTNHMKAGYFRKNGVPYSENAVFTEHYVTLVEPTSDEYLVLTMILEDPQFLAAPYIRSVQFKKQSDATGWKPTGCSAK